MTQNRDFKQRVRARMQKTGERYTAARAQLLVGRDAGEFPVTESVNGYSFAPGVCRDTGAATNMLRAAGLRVPGSGEPLSEALVTGLAGGVGFLYIVFEYGGMPPILSVLMRYDTAADQFVVGGLKRLGVGVDVQETTSAAKAGKALLSALDAGRPALCVVDAVTLAQTLNVRSTAPFEMAGHVPTVVCAVGREDGAIIIDAGRARPLRVSEKAFAEARAAFKKGKHRMAGVPKGTVLKDLGGPVMEAIAACVDRYENAPYKGFASNFGFAGMTKWAELLVDERNAKGWPKLFPEGRLACLGLRRVYEGLEHEMTGPAGGRALYADFLREAATITKRKRIAAAAETYDTAAERWSAIARFIADCDVRAVKSGCEILDRYAELIDADAPVEERNATVGALRESSQACDLSHAAALELYRELAGMVRAATDAERAAVEALRAALP